MAFLADSVSGGRLEPESLGAFLIDADGSGRRRVVRAGGFLQCLSWSADGQRLMFVRMTADATHASYQIGIASVDHGSEVLLREPFPSQPCPTWSPDGGRVAFFGEPTSEGGWPLMVMNADGSNPRQLGAARYVPGHVAWSPDGRRLLAETYAQSHLVSVDASTGAQLGDLTPTGHNWAPAWSPDGTRIAWVSQQGGRPEIWVMNADGTAPHALPRVIPETGGFGDGEPSWSPDGERIAFTRLTGASVIISVRLDGTDPKVMTPPGIQGREATWRPR